MRRKPRTCVKTAIQRYDRVAEVAFQRINHVANADRNAAKSKACKHMLEVSRRRLNRYLFQRFHTAPSDESIRCRVSNFVNNSEVACRWPRRGRGGLHCSLRSNPLNPPISNFVLPRWVVEKPFATGSNISRTSSLIGRRAPI